MFNNLLKHSIRSFKRQRAYIIINILGLAIGIACSLLISLYVINEASFDRYNLKKDRIFRIILNGKIGEQEITASSTPAVMGPTLPKEFPEVEDFLRMNDVGPTVVEYKQQFFTDNDIMQADSSFFNFFTIPVMKGDPDNLLNSPHKVVLSESTAKKLFGSENPIDKLIKIGSDTTRFVVTGIMEDVPSNSHFNASMLTSFMTNPRSKDPQWMNNSFSTYLLLKPNSSHTTVDSKFTDLIVKYVGPELQKYVQAGKTKCTDGNDLFIAGNLYCSTGIIWSYFLYGGTEDKRDRGKESNGIVHYRYLHRNLKGSNHAGLSFRACIMARNILLCRKMAGEFLL